MVVNYVFLPFLANQCELLTQVSTEYKVRNKTGLLQKSGFHWFSLLASAEQVNYYEHIVSTHTIVDANIREILT